MLACAVSTKCFCEEWLDKGHKNVGAGKGYTSLVETFLFLLSEKVEVVHTGVREVRIPSHLT